MGNRERHHVFVCLLFLLHRLTFCPRFKSYLMTRGWTMLKEKRHTGTSTMRNEWLTAYILSKKHHEGWVFSHVLRSPIDSTLRSKASVVCFCECPRTCFCYTWTTILKFGMAPAITGFLIFWKTCILPRHGFGTKLIFSLATKWLRIRGCAGDMLFTCCEGGDPEQELEPTAAWPGTTGSNMSSKSCKTLIFRKNEKQVDAQSGGEIAEN